MTEAKTYRAAKVAKELNISLQTLVDNLTKKGFSIEENPNAKLLPEMYDVLLKEFQSDKKIREESMQINISTKKAREEVVAAEEVRTDKPKTRSDNEPEELLIKNSLVAEVAKPKKEEEAPAVIEPVAEKKEEKPAAPAAPVQETPAEDAKVGGLKVVGKIDLPSAPKKKTEKAPEPEKEAPKPVEQPKAEVKEPVAPVEKKEEAPVVTEPVAEKKEEKPAAPVAPPVEEAPPADTDSVSTPNYQKLQGLRVMGKIELPKDEPKAKPVASSDGTLSGDKKRKRKKVTFVGASDTKIVDPNNPQQQRPQGGGGGGHHQGNRPGGQGGYQGNRPGGQGGYQGNRGGQGRGPNPNYRGNSPNYRGNQTTPGQPAEISSKEIQDKIKATMAKISNTGKSTVGENRSKMRRQKRDEFAAERENRMLQEELESKILKVTEFVTANDLAKMMNVQINEIISVCFSLGMMISINQRLDAETISVVASEFGFEVEFVSADAQDDIEQQEDSPEDLRPRPPIVTVMGHVDHGKTSLLDYIRRANVIASEAGGITQHIGAYEVQLESGKKITFLDTPGHEAFTAMRARGAKLTDVAIIVIAADDSVMPQTREAISHAQAAGVPIVFAFNKIDKEGANADKVREQLAGMDILVEEWGGKYQTQEISAKKGLNIDKLLEKVLLEAELLDLKANPKKRAVGAVVEARLDKGRGVVATLMVEAGTLRVGDMLLAGSYFGKVKAMFNERGAKMEAAGPSTPVSVLGFNGAPAAGDKFHVTATEQEAKEIATKRLQLIREQGLRTHKHITLDEIGRRLAIGNFKELNLIVKGDVDGSVEALSDSLLKLSSEEIQVNVIHKAVGQISESDVLLASASDAIIIGFQVRPSSQARKIAENEDIDIRLYSIIYDAISEIKSAMEGMLAPTFEEKIVCNVEIRETFKISKVGTIAGCYVLDGKITRNTKVRVVRDGVVMFTGELASLKRYKDDVKEVAAGYECGLNVKNFNDIRVGDIIEGFEQVEVKRKLS